MKSASSFDISLVITGAGGVGAITAGELLLRPESLIIADPSAGEVPSVYRAGH